MACRQGWRELPISYISAIFKVLMLPVHPASGFHNSLDTTFLYTLCIPAICIPYVIIIADSVAKMNNQLCHLLYFLVHLSQNKFRQMNSGPILHSGWDRTGYHLSEPVRHYACYRAAMVRRAMTCCSSSFSIVRPQGSP